MSDLPTIELTKETVHISGGRKLYKYDFRIDGEPAKPMSAEDVVESAPKKAENEPAG